MKRKNLTISLIKDNLINTRLLLGLEELGFDTTNYCLYLSETILKVAGVDLSDDDYEVYLDLFEQAKALDLPPNNAKLDIMAKRIYTILKEEFAN